MSMEGDAADPGPVSSHPVTIETTGWAVPGSLMGADPMDEKGVLVAHRDSEPSLRDDRDLMLTTSICVIALTQIEDIVRLDRRSSSEPSRISIHPGSQLRF
jgi:hypothetical protein